MPPPLGGTTVSFSTLVDILAKKKSLAVASIKTNVVRQKGGVGFLSFVKLLWQLATTIPRVSVVSVHTSTTGIHILAPIVVFFALIYRKPVVIRKFGGGDIYAYKGVRLKTICWAVKNASFYLVQTKGLVQLAKQRGFQNARWYSNSRKIPKLLKPPKNKSGCRRFVYIGDVRKEKGIDLITGVWHKLNTNEILVDIYGPLFNDINSERLFKTNGVLYKGALDPDSVIQVLTEYDALLLPTFCSDEGYPGVILEAYAAVLPVIATNLPSIAEIVNDHVGILINPNNEQLLENAILKLAGDPVLFNKMRTNILAKREGFSSEVWADIFVEYCHLALEESRRKRDKT